MPEIEIPTIKAPSLLKGVIGGLKSFAMSVISAIFGLWADTGGTWSDTTLFWSSGGIEYPSERPKIGEIKSFTPIIE